MRIAVYGTGGVGGYFGGRLAQAGEDVTFIARGPHLEAIRRDGLYVDSIKGDFHIYPAQTASSAAEAGPLEAVLLGVKAWQVSQAAQDLGRAAGENTFVIPLQNGVEAASQLEAGLGKGRALGGLCRISAFVAGPGRIKHVGIEPSIAFAELDGSASSRADYLLQAFQRAGVNAEIPGDIQAAIWAKFLFIAAISGVGAAARAPLGVLREQPETRSMLRQAMSEVEAVARAQGVSLPEGIVEKTLTAIDGMQASVNASMQRDIMEGRPSELEAQNGAVVRLGQSAGVPTPLHAALYACLLPQERRARGEISF